MPSAAPTKATHRLRRTPSLRAFITHRSSASTAYAILPLRINTHRTHTPPRPSFKSRLSPEDVDWQKEAKAHDTRHGKKIQTLPYPTSGQCFQSGKLMGKEAGKKLPQKPTAERKTELHTLSTRHTRTACTHTAHVSRILTHAAPPTSSRIRTKKTGSEPCKVPTL